MRERQVIQSFSTRSHGNIREIHRDLPFPMDHMRVVIPDIPSLMAQRSTALQFEGHCDAFALTHVQLLFDCIIIEAAADGDGDRTGRYGFFELTVRTEAVFEAQMVSNQRTVVRADGDG